MIKYPEEFDDDEYIYDYETTNASFISLASILRRKGIKNYNFFLKLYDEDLVGVDPYDENLSASMKLKILIECRRNFWYFIREVVQIPGNGRYQLHRGNLALSFLCLNNVGVYQILPRQHGKTWAVVAYALWVFNFSSEYTNLLFMNKQLSDSQNNLKRLRQCRELLPAYLRMDKVETTKGELRDSPSNVNSMSNSLHNEIDVKASARNPTSADELGRGMTVAWVWIDEFAFLQFNSIIYEAMIPAWAKAAEVAKAKNKPVGKILTTTPSDLSSDMGKYAFDMMDKAAKFDEHLYEMSEPELRKWVRKNSSNDFVFVQFFYEQLSHPDPKAWFEEQCIYLAWNWAKIRREILLQWDNASSNSPFDPEDMRELSGMTISPSELDSITINKYYKLNVYRKLDMSKKYIISVDVGKGRGEKADRTVVCVTDAQTDALCAVFKSPTIQYKETYRFIHTLFYNYIPNSVIVIENNIDTLVEYVKESTMRPFLYYEPVKSNTHDTMKKGIMKRSDTTNIVYGVTTNSANRPKYFDILFDLVKNDKDKINCEELVREIETLEYKTESRIEATPGTHDDVVLAYLIGIYVKRFGTNRARFGLFYANGIDTVSTNTDNRIYDKTASEVFRKPSANDDNEFFAELKQETERMNNSSKFGNIEEMKYQEGFIRSREDELTYTSQVFTGAKDLTGISRMKASAFANLNSRDRFGSSGNNTDLDDDSSDGWF